MGFYSIKKVKGLLFSELKMAEEAKPVVHEFSEEQVDEFKDGFELFDMTGEGIIPWSQCANVARCFGFNPLNRSNFSWLAEMKKICQRRTKWNQNQFILTIFLESCGVSPLPICPVPTRTFMKA